jgi:hypothetical protein
MIPIAALAAVCIACADDSPTASQAGARRALAVGEQIQSCAQFEIRIGSQMQVTVVPLTVPGCAGTLVPVVDSSATLDRKGRLRLPLVLENRGTVTVGPPAHLVSWRDSLRIVTQGSKTPVLQFVNPDSVVPTTSPSMPGALLWKYDTLLAGPGQRQVLAPGARSRVRWVEMDAVGVSVFRVTFHTRAVTTTPTVPLTPPSGRPAELYHESNVIAGSRLATGPYPRNVVVVVFHRAATQAERQAAIDLVGGEVVGGYPRSGIYLVKAPDDGTDAPLVSAIEKLSALPQVASADPDFFLSSSYEKPQDGNGWQRPQWEVDADSASGANWGMERIAAPLAWGCEVGDSTVRVAIIDNGFHNISDLASNTTNPGVAQFGTSTSDHGTRVASIVAARGNNNTQIAGVMWRADLQMYEYGDPAAVPALRLTTAALRDAVITAANDGVPVINISSSLYWLQQAGRLPYGVPGGPAIPHPDSAKADSARVRRIHGTVRDGIAYADTSLGRRPLVIVSASNDGIDAWWSGLALLARDYPDRVLVVGAVDQPGALRFNHNQQGNNLVSIVAPGVDVGVLDGTGTPRLDSGASFAAPHVTGIAGLLLSFDPTLSPAQVRQLIVEGADSAGRVVSGTPTANARWSLRLAARRNGARLCGNRAWMDNAGFTVQRRSAPETSLFGTSTYAPWDILHRGRRMRFLNNGVPRAFEWSAAGWQASALLGGEASPLAARSGDPYRSVYRDPQISNQGVNHSGDTSVVHRRLNNGGVVTDNTAMITDVEVSLRDPGGNRRLIGTLPAALTETRSNVCIRESPDSSGNFTCTATLGDHGVDYMERLEIQTAYAPNGKSVIVLLSRSFTRWATVGSWYSPCDTGYWGSRCMDYTVTRGYRDVRVYSVPVAGGAPTLLWQENDISLTPLGVSAESNELAVTRRTSNSVTFEAWGKPSVLTTSTSTCRAQFRDLRQAGALRFEVPDCVDATYAP